jgi:2-keto-3-deoxy-L-rhamnonate aldolase RhmA
MAPDYVPTCADNLLIVLQIESAKGVENIDEILEVEGNDVMFIGPYDLSGTMGHLGNIKHPDVARAIEHAESRIKAKGLPMGTVPHPGCTWKDMFARGYQFVNAGSDVARLRDGSLVDVKAFREIYRDPKLSAA